MERQCRQEGKRQQGTWSAGKQASAGAAEVPISSVLELHTHKTPASPICPTAAPAQGQCFLMS